MTNQNPSQLSASGTEAPSDALSSAVNSSPDSLPNNKLAAVDKQGRECDSDSKR